MNNNQRDSRWANIPVGFGEQTIGQVGCTISAIGNILGFTSVEVNNRLKTVKGFQYNLVIWSKIPEAFPGVQVRRVNGYNNSDVLANIPNVIVEVPASSIGGKGSHWVRFIGNKLCEDPWTGKIRPTSDFPNPTGYCVINPAVITQPIAQQPQITDQTRIPQIDNKEVQAIRSELRVTHDRVGELDQQIQTARENLLLANSKYTDLKTEYEAYKAQNLSLAGISNSDLMGELSQRLMKKLKISG